MLQVAMCVFVRDGMKGGNMVGLANTLKLLLLYYSSFNNAVFQVAGLLTLGAHAQ